MKAPSTLIALLVWIGSLVFAGCTPGVAQDSAAPSNLTYSTNPSVFTKGVVITNDTPSSTGGAVTSYSVSPALPVGLKLETSSGVISGTPTEVTALAAYVVTAANSKGSTSVGLVITVNALASGAGGGTSGTGGGNGGGTSGTGGGTSGEGGGVAGTGGGDVGTGGGTAGTGGGASGSGGGTSGTGGGGGGSPTSAPSGLSYSTNPAIYTKGVTITNGTPSSTGGAVASYSVSPALPAGLTLNASTGVISGNPTVITTQSTYTVTATNSGGSTSVGLIITVNDVAPKNLAYATNPAVYSKGALSTSNTPSSTGGAVGAYSVSPALPPGLTLNASTGVITGTPTALSVQGTYTVTATNSGGSTSVGLVITVNDVAPSILSYSTNPAVFTKGVAITNDTPSNSGGAVVSYSVSPSLPAGLTLSASTGVIAGTPTAITAQATYTVTAANSGGSASVVLPITVSDVAPSNLSYSKNPAVFTKGIAITNDTPSSTGGAVVSYAVSPSLPPGLTINPSTGVISGTPSVIAAQATYTVTATNSGGSTSVGLVFTLNDVAPSNLTYSKNPAVFTKGAAITNDTPSSTGGAVVSYAVSSALPAGLTLSKSTGEISGTPTAITAQGTYTVTATNSGGSTSIALSITVNDVPPSNLIYSQNPAAYRMGVAITNNTPTSTGGAVLSYTVSPSLPAGLTLNTSTGVISGTPAAIAAQATYTVTATNSGGSTPVDISIRADADVNGMQGSVVGGEHHTCALVNGGVQCWGSNAYAQLGNDSSANSGVPVQVQGLTSGVQALSAGGFHTCALVNGGVQCWGYGTSGELGNNAQAISHAPVQVQGLTSEVQLIAAGFSHTCALTNGNVKCWGLNSHGQLGNNPAVQEYLVPVQVQGLTSGVQAITAGMNHTCALVNGGVQCWGSNAEGELGNNSTSDSFTPVPVQGLSSGVKAIAAGGYHTCAITNGGVQCWGSNTDGALGNPSATSGLVPVQVQGLSSGVQAIAGVGFGTCALVNGGVQCWGRNGNGQLGNNSTLDSHVPVQVQGLPRGVQAIAAGFFHVCALVSAGVQCWGYNTDGQLGNNATTDGLVPVQVKGLSTGVQAIAAGDGHTCALVGGGAQCWGFNLFGGLGNGAATDSHVPVQVSGLASGVQAIATGPRGGHTCALVNGGVECWGPNGYGQLGNNSLTNSHVPVQVQGLSSGVQAIAAGDSHTCALVNGGVQCWGYNGAGQLGNNSLIESHVPVQVQGLSSGVQAIAAGGNHTCALVNGGIQCWGTNLFYELGNTSTTIQFYSLVPVQVQGLSSGVQAITAGDFHTCALVNGGAQCWGYNAFGELGDNSLSDRRVPTQVYSLSSGVQAITSGDYHTCALVNGGVRCWGNNSNGQVGTAGAYSLIPVQGPSSGLQAVTAGGLHSCAMISDAIQCWGSNSNGQLGNNSTTDSSVPVPVVGLFP